MVLFELKNRYKITHFSAHMQIICMIYKKIVCSVSVIHCFPT